MPPIRAIPNKPLRTERTHEENQERAYIAASRRSDRSLEARVESARRASEIHKKRTGRSLRVREEDVVNEEMYEEEDDDLPMQYRRIAALNPGWLGDRIGNFLVGQAGMRSALHNAIFQANQNNQQFQQQNPYLNLNHNTMQQPGMLNPHAFTGFPQSPYPMNNNNVQGMRAGTHMRSTSVANPQDMLARSSNLSNTGMDARRMSVPAPTLSPGVPSPVGEHQHSASTSQPPTPHAVGASPHQVPTPYSMSGSEQMSQGYHTSAGMPSMSGFDGNIEEQVAPLTTKIPMAQQQLMGRNVTHPSQLSPSLPTPSMSSHGYNPNGKPKRPSNSDNSSYFSAGLDQTLTSADMFGSHTLLKTEPQSAVSAPAEFTNTFDQMMAHSMGNYEDPKFDFNAFDHGDSGQVTPGEVDQFAFGGELLQDYDYEEPAKV